MGLIAAAAPVRSPVVVVAPPSSVSFRSILAGGYGLSYQAHSGVVTAAGKYRVDIVQGIFDPIRFQIFLFSSPNMYMYTYPGDVYIWGWNAFGQLGLGSAEFSTFYTQPFPHFMRAFSSNGVAALSLGQFSSAALTVSNASVNAGRGGGGELLTWGTNEHGILGKGLSHIIRTTTVQRWGLLPTSIQCGKMCASTGDFVPSTVEYPMRVPTDRDNGNTASTSLSGSSASGSTNNMANFLSSAGPAKAVQVVLGAAHAMLRDTKGRVYSWGLNIYGQLGLGDHRDRAFPELV